MITPARSYALGLLGGRLLARLEDPSAAADAWCSGGDRPPSRWTAPPSTRGSLATCSSAYLGLSTASEELAPALDRANKLKVSAVEVLEDLMAKEKEAEATRARRLAGRLRFAH